MWVLRAAQGQREGLLATWLALSRDFFASWRMRWTSPGPGRMRVCKLCGWKMQIT
jgi:hypothetical protein